VNGLRHQLFTHPLFPIQQNRKRPARRLPTGLNQSAGLRIVGGHLLEGMADFTQLAGH
jgi:hypothetical protein